MVVFDTYAVGLSVEASAKAAGSTNNEAGNKVARVFE
jgi:hypothetical protein